MTGVDSSARDRAIEAARGAIHRGPAGGSVASAATVVDALLARPKVLRALAGAAGVPATDDPEHNVTEHWDAHGGDVLWRTCSCGERWTSDQPWCPDGDDDPAWAPATPPADEPAVWWSPTERKVFGRIPMRMEEVYTRELPADAVRLAPAGVATPDVTALLREAGDALRAVGKAAIVVRPTLDKPYPDEPSTSPWKRFVEEPAKRAYNLGSHIRALLAADTTEEAGRG